MIQHGDVDKHVPEPSHGPDEEGETPLPEEAHETDRAAWVHRKDPVGTGSDKASKD